MRWLKIDKLPQPLENLICNHHAEGGPRVAVSDLFGKSKASVNFRKLEFPNFLY
jgi:hypothetical protein